MWPSPDGGKIAFATFDDSKVEDVTWTKYSQGDVDNGGAGGGGGGGDIEHVDQSLILEKNVYPEIKTLKYPKAGSTNPTVKLWLIDLDSLEDLQSVELKPPQSFKFE